MLPQVLIFDTPALASGSQDPEETVKLPVDGSGVCDPPRALSWGEGAARGGVAYLLLIVGADRSASIARVGGTEEFAGEEGDLAVEPVAGGERVFTSGCWLLQGMGRFALGTVAGEVKVFQESGLKTPIGSTPFPDAQLDISPKAEVRFGVSSVLVEKRESGVHADSRGLRIEENNGAGCSWTRGRVYACFGVCFEPAGDGRSVNVSNGHYNGKGRLFLMWSRSTG